MSNYLNIINQDSEIVVAPCIPEYRDAIIFLDHGRIVQSLSICFQCIDIRDINENRITAGIKFYEEYSNFLMKFGHQAYDDEEDFI